MANNHTTFTDSDLAAIQAAIRATANPAQSQFAHLKGLRLGDPQMRAFVDWAATLARAEQIVAADKRATTVQATAQQILRAAAVARGTIVPMPTDETARAIIRSGRVRRGEE